MFVLSLWMAMSHKFCEQPFDWSLLVTCLQELNTNWNPEHVYTEEVNGSSVLLANTQLNRFYDRRRSQFS